MKPTFLFCLIFLFLLFSLSGRFLIMKKNHVFNSTSCPVNIFLHSTCSWILMVSWINTCKCNELGMQYEPVCQWPFFDGGICTQLVHRPWGRSLLGYAGIPEQSLKAYGGDRSCTTCCVPWAVTHGSNACF